MTTHVIIAFINSSLYSYETYTQVKEMDNLNLFIDSHYKYIVLSIRERHVLTLHLSTANWRILLTTGCCCKNAAASPLHTLCNFCQVESIPQFLKLWPVFNALWWNSNFTLLYRNATSYDIIYKITEYSEKCLMIRFKLQRIDSRWYTLQWHEVWGYCTKPVW